MIVSVGLFTGCGDSNNATNTVIDDSLENAQTDSMNDMKGKQDTTDISEETDDYSTEAYLEADEFEEEKMDIIMDSDVFSINGNSEGNRHNGGWVAEQGDWNYYAISGRIYKENMLTGEKYAIFDSMSNTASISLQVMGEWIYFEIGDNNLYRISVDGSTGQKYDPILGNDVIIDWDVYNGNVYTIVRENLSASTYNYYLAITDWSTQTYQKIYDIGDMGLKNIDKFPEDYSFAETADLGSAYRFFYLGAPYFLGIDDGYAYFIYTTSESDKDSSSFIAYRINLDNLGDTDEISWTNNKDLPYCRVYVSDNCIYALGFAGGSPLSGNPEKNYYDIIDFRNSDISTYWVPELVCSGNTKYCIINVSTLGIIHWAWQFVHILGDSAVEISEDRAEKICTAQNQVYYFCNDMYCRINLDGTGWESIDLNSFNWIDSTLVFE